MDALSVWLEILRGDMGFDEFRLWVKEREDNGEAEGYAAGWDDGYESGLRDGKYMSEEIIIPQE